LVWELLDYRGIFIWGEGGSSKAFITNMINLLGMTLPFNIEVRLGANVNTRTFCYRSQADPALFCNG
jgi:hypothetical protein